METKKRRKIMDAGKGFVNLSVMVGIFFSGLSFGLGHLYIGFGFMTWVVLAIVTLFDIRKDEEAKEND
ncbi:hypothetical protein [Ligilactobacillus salivarius]|uniref:hypothetical protein n=1 Tax=Ligilactobacillus salivarius TaxID=1624 RepID=UPI00177EC8B6|nr:hypothetical protein [Ligilactobacillus salivarius]